MTRDEFKIAVFRITNGKYCVPGCGCDAVDAHHIMNRCLWSDGGYILSNGAALRAKHHLDAEKGVITPRQCIEYMGIPNDGLKKPDELDEYLTREEYLYFLFNDGINAFGELKYIDM